MSGQGEHGTKADPFQWLVICPVAAILPTQVDPSKNGEMAYSGF